MCVYPNFFTDAYASCHSGWMPYTGAYCVRKFDLRKNWFEARASCRSHGAELVTVASWNQNVYMRGYLRDSGKATSIDIYHYMNL